MNHVQRLCRSVIVIGLLPLCARAATTSDQSLKALPFTAVEFHDAFWTPRLEANRENTLPHLLRCCEQTGRISNFAKAGKLIDGRHEGTCANDSDVFKLIQGASYSLATHPDPALEKTVDAVISQIAAAQQPDGYLNTYFTLAEPGRRWTDLKDKHELYCAGHLFEAAVAHWQATGKRTLLDVATKYADYIAETFGPTKRLGLCGHEEIELALVKLCEATREERYLGLAEFFLDLRGDPSRRALWGPYYQDHMPVRRQTEIAGHAVRAMYLNSAMIDVARQTGDRLLIDAADRVWNDLIKRKMYITGGIGARHEGESFGNAYELPNESAYCETCAAVGLALWAHRMNLLHGDAQYADVLERVIYNGFLSGVGLDGTHFFYVNPLASKGKHHRQPFLDPACCPTNAVRFVPSLPGYAYATGQDAVYLNLYVAGAAEIGLGERRVVLTQKTLYPWEGNVQLTVDPDSPCEFGIALRIPDWCASAAVQVNGAPAASLEIQKGYARLQRRWQAGDTVQLTLPMPIRLVQSDPRVEANIGRVAVQRGPVVYCFEAADNGPLTDVVLAADAELACEHRPDLLGGVTVVACRAEDGRKLFAVPYYAWDHRAPGEMIVWVRQVARTDSAAAGSGS